MMSIRITGVEVTELRVPDMDAIAHAGTGWTCLVRVHTDGGDTGVSEVTSVPSVIRAIIDAPAVLRAARGLASVETGKRFVPHGYKTHATDAVNLNLLAQHWRHEPLEYCVDPSPLRSDLTRERFAIDGEGMVRVPTGAHRTRCPASRPHRRCAASFRSSPPASGPTVRSTSRANGASSSSAFAAVRTAW